MKPGARMLRPALPVLAGALMFVGERIVPATPARWPLTGAGALALLAALAWGLALWRRAEPGQARAWRLVLLPTALFALAAIAYAVSLKLESSADTFPATAPVRYGVAMLALVGALWFVFIEMAVWSQGATVADPARVGRAALAGLNLGLLIALVVTVNFALNKTAWQWDVAYFKTTDPSQVTLDTVAALDAPIDVALFFTEGDAVGQLAGDYFRKLTRSGAGKVTLKFYDADLNPVEAKDFKAPRNGTVVFRRGEQIKSIQLGQGFDRARAQLKKFDGDVLSNLVELSRERRTAYFTVGHGERNERNRQDADAESGISAFETVLRSKAYVIKPLGMAQGLGSSIPEDAALLVIVGPVDPFSKPEAQAVRRYLERGGRLLVFLEPRASGRADPLAEVLSSYGIQFENAVLANDRIFARRTYTDADHALLVTTAFGPHTAANTIRRAPDQFPLVFLSSGGLRRGKEPPEMQLRDIVKTMPGTWIDRNRNFRFDAPAEKREDLALVMGVGPAAPRPPPKGKEADPAKGKDAPKPQPALPSIVVYADADAVSDLLMQNRANGVLAADAAGWLGGDEAPAGLPTSEEDQRIQHAQASEWVWFYLPVVGVPLLILAIGFYLSGRRRAMAGGGG